MRNKTHKVYVLFWFDRELNEHVIYGIYTTELKAESASKGANEKGYGGCVICAHDLEGGIECLQSGSHFTDTQSVTSYESITPTMLLNKSRKRKNRKNGLNYI
jgi:hypothetical protein